MAKEKDAVTVDRIEITVGRKKFSMTPEELKELRDVLDRVFPKPIVSERPIIIERPVYRDPWRHWKVSWAADRPRSADDNSGTLCINSKT